MINLELYELKNLCMEMAELGAANYARQIEPATDIISQRAAYRRFGEARVKRWASSGIITCIRSGSAKNSRNLYSLAELLAADKSERLNAMINK